MKTFDNFFDTFYDFLEQEIITNRKTFTYREVCRKCRIPHLLFNLYLLKHFGLSGKKIVQAYVDRKSALKLKL